jgi:DNA-binding GntR family transcriptional regulator
MRGHVSLASNGPRNSSTTSLTLVAYHRLLDMITTGELPAGAIVQERPLAKALNISRTPLRDALFRLEGEGLLVRHQQGVLQVKSFTLEDYTNALRVRLVIECEAARLAAGNMPAPVIAAVRAHLEAVLRRLDAPDQVLGRIELDHVDDAVHHAVADASGNPLLAELIRTVRQRSRLFGLERRPTRMRAICAEHGAILDAIASGNAATAVAAMSRHLENVTVDLRDRFFDPGRPLNHSSGLAAGRSRNGSRHA